MHGQECLASQTKSRSSPRFCLSHLDLLNRTASAAEAGATKICLSVQNTSLITNSQSLVSLFHTFVSSAPVTVQLSDWMDHQSSSQRQQAIPIKHVDACLSQSYLIG